MENVPAGSPPGPDDERVAPGRRLRRAQRREQVLAAATSLDDVAAEAGVSRVILYRHFESKSDLYRAVLDRACGHLLATVGDREMAAARIGQAVSAIIQSAADLVSADREGAVP